MVNRLTSRLVGIINKHKPVKVSRLNVTIMVTAKKYILNNHFHGFPKVEDLKLVEEELPTLNDGGKFIWY